MKADSLYPFSACTHCDPLTGRITDIPMDSVSCTALLRIYTPQNLSRCPRILILCKGPHTHPLPIPASTPVPIQAILQQALLGTGIELGQMTARRAMIDNSIRAALRTVLPHLDEPMLGDLHISLYNKAHLSKLIEKVKLEVFSCGTEWEGMYTVTTVWQEAAH